MIGANAKRFFADWDDVQTDEAVVIAKVAEGERLDSASVAKRMVYHAVKRGFDVCFSALMTVVAIAPVGMACVLIMLETPGNPFYLQERIGRGGKPFKIIKLRSMVPDAGDVERYLTDEQLRQWHAERKVCDDPRITKVGRIIRQCYIDELPQFINVLRGEMSVVGPRPISVTELRRWFSEEERGILLSVRPGITGCWQVSASGTNTYENGKRQFLELWYVRHANLLVDAMAVLETITAIVRRDGD